MKAIHTLHSWGWSIILSPGSPNNVQDREVKEIEIDYTRLPDTQAWCVQTYGDYLDPRVYEVECDVEGLSHRGLEGSLYSVFHAPDAVVALQQAELFVEACSKVVPCVKYVHFSAGNTKAAANVTIVEEDKPNEQECMR